MLNQNHRLPAAEKAARPRASRTGIYLSTTNLIALAGLGWTVFEYGSAARDEILNKIGSVEARMIRLETRLDFERPLVKPAVFVNPLQSAPSEF